MFGRTRPEAQVMIRMVMPRRPWGRSAGIGRTCPTARIPCARASQEPAGADLRE